MSALPGRRTFLKQVTAAAVLNVRGGLAAQAIPPATLRLAGGKEGPVVPQDFLGLSYEVSQLADPAFFSPRNGGLVQQFRNIAPRGVLRLGGNTSEFGWWEAATEATAPHWTGSFDRSGKLPLPAVYAITPEAIRELKGFLDATGWTCIYGLNLGHGSPATAVPEASFVYVTLGPKLQFFQIGNEVDLFGGQLRDKSTWNVGAYLDEWLAIARAVGKACPGASFGLPDVASNMAWLRAVADRWSAIPDRPRVTTLSHHYYFGGPPANPLVSIDNLLKPSATVQQQAEIASTAATRTGMKFRMTEGNTCYGGGKPGVSDVFAAALWSADYFFRLMQFGYAGAHLHGGSGRAAAGPNGDWSAGGQIVDGSQMPHPTASYTPIAEEAAADADAANNAKDRYVLQPVGAGMKFAAAFTGAQTVPVELVTELNVSAYAARRKDGKVLVAILNKEATQVLEVTAPNFQTLQTLTGRALDAREARVSAVVRETSSRRSAAGQTFLLPPHFATLIVLE